MNIFYVAQLFETHTRSLVWLFPVLIPAFLIIFAPYFLLVIGSAVYAWERIAKRRTYVGKTLLAVGAAFLPVLFANQFIPVLQSVAYPFGDFINIFYVIATVAVFVMGVILSARYRADKARHSIAKTLLWISAVLIGLHIVEVIGVVGAANSK